MKRKELEYILNQKGYSIIRNTKHVIWSNGIVTVAVPRHKEINGNVSKKILKEIGE